MPAAVYEPGMLVRVVSAWPPYAYGDVVDPARLGWLDQNVRAAVGQGRLELMSGGASTTKPAQRHKAHIGRGLYHVIEGVMLTPEPVTSAEADAIVDGD